MLRYEWLARFVVAVDTTATATGDMVKSKLMRTRMLWLAGWLNREVSLRVVP